ncbi:MAG TPA: PIG-L family deacetylase [Acetobacteraceae bacterium]|jgi:LmbE family N-acetylglucosaminyl deacetylase|nr:PIG-L family deacetylase [Acetobacteraceae bacterium]
MIAAARLHHLWQALPVGTLTDVIGSKSCLVLAPHPDDESLGCGGLIAACCAASRPPVVVILTDGSGSHPGSRLYPPAKLATLREQEVAHAVRVLGLPPERLICLREPDTNAPHVGPRFDAIVRRLSDYVRDLDCSTILAPWRLDAHRDHESAALLACQTARVARIQHLSYPVWGWTLADDVDVDEVTVQGWRLDVAAQLDVKRNAIAAHASQYGGLITDDPRGFQLPVGLLKAVDSRWETFLLP